MNSRLKRFASEGSVFLSSLKSTISEVESAVKHRRPSILIGLLREGSPLEALVNSVVSAVFWVLVLAPVFLVPVYYLLLSLK
jgi:hypothetical protein